MEIVQCRFCLGPLKTTYVAKHLRVFHAKELSEGQAKKSKSFHNWNEFIEWKDDIESSTFSRFNVRSHPNGSRSYKCFRSGFTGQSTSKGVRQPKIRGSCKLNGTCPAFIKARVSVDGRVSVRFSLEHNHADDPQHVRLSKSDHDFIQEKVDLGIPPARIVADAREGMVAEPLTRLHLLSTKDIWNSVNGKRKTALQPVDSNRSRKGVRNCVPKTDGAGTIQESLYIREEHSYAISGDRDSLEET